MRATARTLPLILVLPLATTTSVTCSLYAQTTVGTGSIVGTVSDPTSAFISGARVTITNTATEQAIELTTNSSGSF
jgi:hypothetical protein